MTNERQTNKQIKTGRTQTNKQFKTLCFTQIKTKKLTNEKQTESSLTAK